MEAPKKEIIFAVILGLFAGILFSFTVWMIRNKTFSNSVANNNVKITPTKTTEKTNKPLFLSISEPKTDPYITSENKITIKGETLSDSKIIISAEDQDFVTHADKDGNFTKTISLKNAVNRLYFVAFDSLGNQKTTSLDVYYGE